jgi:peptide/nickel transport system permease protein
VILFLLRRLLLTIPVIWGVATVTFLLIHFVPGDPVEIMLGENAASVDKAALRASLGLDMPLPQQYGQYLKHLSKFDLGKSLQSKRSVSAEIAERIPATVELTLAAMALAILVGIPLGLLAAIRRFSWLDHAILLFSLLGISLPGFFLGPLLIWVFAIHFDWLPVSDRGGWEHLLLPAVSLALGLSAILIRITRANMLEVIREDYVRTARAKGVNTTLIYFKHALANALIPIISVVGLQFGALLTGAVITETIFDWPGVGTLLYTAIQSRNYPLVQGCTLFISITYVAVNLFTDIAYGLADPKVRQT